MTLAEISQIIGPVFGLIGVGYVAAAIRLLKPQAGEAMGEFVFTLPIPVLIFRTIATATLPDVSPWPLWLAYFAGVVVTWSLSSRLARHGLGVSRAEAVIAGASASFSNTVMIGIPLIFTAFGEAGTIPLFLIISVHLPVMMIAGMLMTEHAARLDGLNPEPMAPLKLLRRIGVNLLTNPLVIALAAGAVWRHVAPPPSGALKSIIDQLAAAAVPCALISLGVGLHRYGPFGQIRIGLMTAMLKLLLMPAVVYLVASRLTNLPPLWVHVATLCAAAPAGVNSYLFAVRFEVGQAGAASAITLSCLLGIGSLALWLGLLTG